MGVERVLDYWRTVHNRNSIDGNGMGILSYVHYTPNGSGWNNSQWVGGNNHFMQYGDGDGIIFNSLTALDISAHEMGHGITEFTAGLNPGTQESGALNEGFSDIWAACVEHWAAPFKQTWLMGEEVMANFSSCLRSLINPKTGGFRSGPDTYHGQLWDNNGEPHTNSSVLSHWFYLISQGGNGTNDIGNTFSVSAIGINIAQLIAFRAESMYLNSSANYVAARNATISAARDLYGIGSCQEITVTNAWYAVGVGANYDGTSIMISGPDYLCSSALYKLQGVPVGAPITWSVSDPNIATVTPLGYVTATWAVGTFILTASTNNSCGTSINVTKTISIGAPNISTYTVVGAGTVYANAGYAYSVTYPWGAPPPVNISWRVPAGWTIVNGQGTEYINIWTGSAGGFVEVNFDNVCGESTGTFKTVVIGTGGPDPQVADPSTTKLVISPNPATNDVVISLLSNETKTGSGVSNFISKIKVIDKMGIIKKQFVFSNKKASQLIKIAGLRADTYVIQAFTGNQWLSGQLLILNN
jgi:bacillolysin